VENKKVGNKGDTVWGRREEGGRGRKRGGRGEELEKKVKRRGRRRGAG